MLFSEGLLAYDSILKAKNWEPEKIAHWPPLKYEWSAHPLIIYVAKRNTNTNSAAQILTWPNIYIFFNETTFFDGTKVISLALFFSLVKPFFYDSLRWNHEYFACDFEFSRLNVR